MNDSKKDYSYGINDDVNELIKVVSNYVGPALKTKLQLAVAENYEVIINKQKWSCRYPLCRDSSSVLKSLTENKETLLHDVKFSSLPPRIRDYMKDTHPLAGTFIEIFVAKNNIVKETSTVFNNNLLCSTSNKKDAPLIGS